MIPQYLSVDDILQSSRIYSFSIDYHQFRGEFSQAPIALLEEAKLSGCRLEISKANQGLTGE